MIILYFPLTPMIVRENSVYLLKPSILTSNTSNE